MPAITLPDVAHTPQLGWSSTRSETFGSYRHRYFFQYNGATTRSCRPYGACREPGLKRHRRLHATRTPDCRVTPGNFPPRCSQNRT